MVRTHHRIPGLPARVVTAFVLAALCFAAIAYGFATSADAAEEDAKSEDAKPFTAKVTGRLVPADLKPGQSGQVVVRLDPGKYRIQDTNLKWKPIPVAGVTYDKSKAVVPKQDYVYTDDYDDVMRYWKKPFEISLPITLAKTVKLGTEVGIEVNYVACNKEMCGPNHGVEVLLAIGKPATARKPKVSPPVTHEEGEVSLRLSDDGKAAIVRFAPAFGWHFYLPPSTKGVTISIAPEKADGVAWGEFKIPQGEELNEAMEVTVPFTRTDAAAVKLRVEWSACQDATMMGARCSEPRDELFAIAFDKSAEGATVRTKGPVAVAEGDIAFPVIDTGELGDVKKKDDFSALLKEKGLLAVLGILFLIGAGLAFTPCVFPIIPLVVATITGGSEVSKGRLTTLLTTYVLGLCIAFSTIGLIAALGGGSMSAAFESQAAQWGFAILFIVMAFGMLGLFELQPPQWLMKLQGGAQNKGGSIVGAFLLGVLGAVLASPCTGPVIVGLIALVATSGDAAQGFLLFFTLGLGMGVVFFAFGSLNFALRPGPWMVWVRYVFGMLLFGAAMYYIGQGSLARGWSVALAIACALAFLVLALGAKHGQHSTEKSRGHMVLKYMLVAFVIVAGLAVAGVIPTHIGGTIPVDMLIAGVLIAIASAAALFWHLHGKEGERKGVAGKRAIAVACMYAVALGLAAYLTWPAADKISWTYVADRAELIREIEKAKAEGKPAIVDIWAET